jgi:hypothetical protein
MKLTTHLSLAPMLKMHGVLPPHPHASTWPRHMDYFTLHIPNLPIRKIWANGEVFNVTQLNQNTSISVGATNDGVTGGEGAVQIPWYLFIIVHYSYWLPWTKNSFKMLLRLQVFTKRNLITFQRNLLHPCSRYKYYLIIQSHNLGNQNQKLSLTNSRMSNKLTRAHNVLRLEPNRHWWWNLHTCDQWCAHPETVPHKAWLQSDT